MRKTFVCGNWKMHKSVAETREFFSAFLPLVDAVTDVEIGIAPPATALWAASECAKGSAVRVGSQNVHWADEGAFTGELSARMVKESGADFAVIGHSERRQYFGETDSTVASRTCAALRTGLTPIVCVGETLDERDAGRHQEVVTAQVEGALGPVLEEGLDIASLVLAYEPVWAIGTGRTASPAQAEQMHGVIRRAFEKLFGADRAASVRILYGGSVKPENAAEILTQANVDGALVGGASLVAETFASVVQFRV